MEYIVLHQNYFEYELVSDAFCLDVIIAILLYIILADATATRNDASMHHKMWFQFKDEEETHLNTVECDKVCVCVMNYVIN